MGSVSRWLGLAGVAFVGLAFLGLNFMGDTPSLDDASAAEIIEHWTQVANGNMAATFLVLCVPFLVIFGAAVLARHRGSGVFVFDSWSFVFGVGIAVAAVGFVWEAAGVAAIADVAHSGFSDMVLQLHVGGGRLHMIWAAGLSLTLIGAAGMFIRRSGFDRVLGWIALVVGIVGLLPEPIGLAGTLAAVVWILIASVTNVARTT